MKLRTKFICILFYMFALLILVLNGSFRLKYLNNFWGEFKDIITKHCNKTEDKDYILTWKHKYDK